MSFTVTKPTNKKVVVMLDGFNPPLKVHIELMRKAIEAVNADKGIFVMESQDCTVRRRYGQGYTFREENRLEMLRSICRYDERFAVSNVRIRGKIIGDNFSDFDVMSVLNEVQKEYPESVIYLFAFNVFMLDRLFSYDDFFARFKLIITDSSHEHQQLAKYPDSVTFLEYTYEIRYIIDHHCYFQFAEIQERVTPDILDILRTKTNFVNGFANGSIRFNDGLKYFLSNYFSIRFNDELNIFLSNYFKCSIEYGGLTYKSAEAAYQAQKCITDEERIPFTHYTPYEAHEAGQKVKLRSDWEKVKLVIMEEIVRAKFVQNKDIASYLHDYLIGDIFAGGRRIRGEAILEECSRQPDLFWGIDEKTGEGENHLGKILMKIREEVRHRIFEERISDLSHILGINFGDDLVRDVISGGIFSAPEFALYRIQNYFDMGLGDIATWVEADPVMSDYYLTGDEILHLIERLSKSKLFAFDIEAYIHFKNWICGDEKDDIPVIEGKRRRHSHRARRSSGWKSHKHRKQWEHNIIEQGKHEYRRKNLPLCMERNDLYDDEEQDCINGRQL